jgi:hypothetical protein
MEDLALPERPVEYLEHVRAYFGRIGFSEGAP